MELLIHVLNPVDTGRKLNVHKMFKRHLGRLLNVLCTFDLHPVSTGKFHFLSSSTIISKKNTGFSKFCQPLLYRLVMENFLLVTLHR